MSNRWIDAGYMKAAPGSVTQVYLFLCRWADNGTHLSAQPMKTIATQCGLSEDIARVAARELEAWGALVREPGTGARAINKWTLPQLLPEAPPRIPNARRGQEPDKPPPKETTPPVVSTPPLSTALYQPEYYQPEETTSLLDPPPTKLSQTPPPNYDTDTPDFFANIHDPISSNPPAQPILPSGEASTEKTANRTLPGKTNSQPEEVFSTPNALVLWWMRRSGVEQPLAYPKLIGQAKQLIKGGVTPGTIDDLYQFCSWAGSVDLGLMVSQYNKWKAAPAPSRSASSVPQSSWV